VNSTDSFHNIGSYLLHKINIHDRSSFLIDIFPILTKPISNSSISLLSITIAD